MRLSACISAAVLSLVGVFAFAGEARAQGTPNQPPPAAPPPVAQPAVQPGPAGGPNAPNAPHAAGAGEEKEEGRLRIGFNVNGGYGAAGDLSGPVFGGTFRIGWQLDRLMGVYGQVSPYAWVASNSKLTGVSLGAIAGYQFTPMFSLTPADIIELAAGPSLDLLSGGATSASAGPGGGTVSANAFSGTYFAVHARAALHFGSRNEETGRRRGFALGLDVHPTFTPGTLTMLYTLGLGYDWL